MNYFSYYENLDAVFRAELKDKICAGFALNKNSKEKISKYFQKIF